MTTFWFLNPPLPNPTFSEKKNIKIPSLPPKKKSENLNEKTQIFWWSSRRKIIIPGNKKIYTHDYQQPICLSNKCVSSPVTITKQ